MDWKDPLNKRKSPAGEAGLLSAVSRGHIDPSQGTPRLPLGFSLPDGTRPQNLMPQQR
jgi:hypothetical protein